MKLAEDLKTTIDKKGEKVIVEFIGSSLAQVSWPELRELPGEQLRKS